MTASAWAAKPGGGADTTAPAAVASITVQSAARALTLHFTATGDDGLTGTATRYDVRFEVNASPPNCLANPGPGATPAPRSATMKPLAGGSVDLFTVRPLSSGTDYCVWIRVLDEAGNSSAWSVVPTRTEGLIGEWPLTAILPDPDAAAANLGVIVRGLVGTLDDAPALGEPRVLGAWQINDTALGATSEHLIGIRLASVSAPDSGDGGPVGVCASDVIAECAETILLSDPALSAHITALSGDLAVAAIPGPDVAGLVVRGSVPAAKRNQLPVSKTLLLERGDTDWRSEVLPFVLGYGGGQTESNLAYVEDALTDGVWNPVLTSVRTEANGRSTLVLWEREGGTWTQTDLFSRINSTWGVRRLLVAPNGELRIWVQGGNGYNGRYLQGTRTPGGWSWIHYDAGPSASSSGVPEFGVGVDGGDQLVVVRSVGGAILRAIRQGAFGAWAPGLPADTDTGTLQSSAWQQIYAPLPENNLNAPMGVGSDCGGAVRVGAVPLYTDNLSEVRVLPDAFASPPSSGLAIDHVHGGYDASLVGLPDGDVAMLTVWRTFRGSLKNTTKPQEDVYLVRGKLGSCAP